MDCYDPVDDYCDVWQAKNLTIPEKIPSTENNLDLFFIAIEMETTTPTINDQEEQEEEEEEKDFSIRTVNSNFLTFWEPCPRLKSGNLPKDRISSILSEAGVPLHKQEFMVDRISCEADKIANAPFNKDSKVLPVLVSISVVECSCFDR